MNDTAVIIGSLHYDIIVEAPHLPQRDETAIGRRWYPKAGGKGGNQAVAARRAGVPARMAGAVGDDDFGRFLRGNLRGEGVDDSFVATLSGAGSGMSVAIVDPGGDYAATIVSGANLLIAPATVSDPALWQGAALLILQNEVPEAVNLAAARAARARSLPVLLNAAPFRPLAPGLLAAITHLIVNRVEAEALGAAPVTSLAAAGRAAERLAGLAPHVIVTAGAHGLAAAQGGETVSVPAKTVQAVSSHGAGDAFVGALAAALIRGRDLASACGAAGEAAADHVAGRAAP